MKMLGERAGDRVWLVCTGADKWTWHTGDAQCLFVERTIESVNKDSDPGMVG